MTALREGRITLKSVNAWWQVGAGTARLRRYLKSVCKANPQFHCDILERRISKEGDVFRVCVRYSDDQVWICAYLGYKLSASPGEPVSAPVRPPLSGA